jgi:hypothetical protein
MTSLQASKIVDAFTPSPDAATRLHDLAEIGRLYLATSHGPAPLTAAEVVEHDLNVARLYSLVRRVKREGGGK